MNILPIAKRIRLAEEIFAGETLRTAADRADTNKNTAHSFCQVLGPQCERVWSDLISTSPRHGLSIGEDVFFLEVASNKHSLPTCVAAYVEDLTKALIGFGCGEDTIAATRDGRRITGQRCGEAAFAFGVESTAHRPMGINSLMLKSEATQRSLLWMFAAHYNLVATNESGETPAMLLGVSEDPWTVEQLVRAALREHVDAKPIPARFTAPAEVPPAPAPALEAAPGNQAPMAAKLVKIHYGAPATLSACKLTMISDVGTNGTLVIGDVTCGLCLARASKIDHASVSMVAPEPHPVVAAPSSAEVLPSDPVDEESTVVALAPRPAKPARAAAPAVTSRTVSSSGFRGVTPTNGAWRAAVCFGGAVITVGTYATPEDAARAYDAKALELKGPGAMVNFEASRTSHEPLPAPRGAKRGRKPKSTEQDPEDQQGYLALATGQRQPGKLPVTPNLLTHKDIEGEQEAALILRFQNGDADAGGILAQAHEKLIDYFSKRQRRGCSDADYEDIKQAARLGFLRAVQKFDRDRGAKLSTYAIHWVKTFVQSHIDNTRTAVRVPRNILGERRKAARRGIEIADLAGATAPAIETAQYNYAGVSTDAPLSEDGWTLGDMLADDSASPERALAYAEEQEALRHKLANAMRGLTEREAEVIRRIDLADDPETLQEVGDSLGLSRERIRQLQAKGHAKLRIILSDKVDDVDSLAEEDDAEFPQELLVTEKRRGRKGSSGFFGVTFVKATGKWRVTLYDNGKSRNHGEWLTAEGAARAYDRVALKFKGPHAELNFPNDRQSTLAAIASAAAAETPLAATASEASEASERLAPPPDPAPAAPPFLVGAAVELAFSSPLGATPLEVVAVRPDEESSSGWSLLVEFPIPYRPLPAGWITTEHFRASQLQLIRPAVLPAPTSPTTSVYEDVEQLVARAADCAEGVAPSAARVLRAALGQTDQTSGIMIGLLTVLAGAIAQREESRLAPGDLEPRLSSLVLWTVLRRAGSALRASLATPWVRALPEPDPLPIVAPIDIVTPAEKKNATTRPSKARPERIIVETTDEIADYAVRHPGLPSPADLLDPSRLPKKPPRRVQMLDD